MEPPVLVKAESYCVYPISAFMSCFPRSQTPFIGIPHPPFLTITIVAHTHVDQELLSQRYWYHDKLNQGILITTIMTPKQQPFVQPGVYLNEFLPSFWQRQINAAEQETPDYRHPLLPLARIKKVMKSDPDVKVRT